MHRARTPTRSLESLESLDNRWTQMDSDGTSWNQGEDLISQRYDINSRNPGGASFEKVAKVSPHVKMKQIEFRLKKCIYIYALKYIESANTIAEC